MCKRKLIFGVGALLALLISTNVTAATLVKDCNCDTMSAAASRAQLHAYNLNNGNHTIFIVDLAGATQVWKFEVNVVVTGPGFGEKTITLLSSEAAPQSVIDGFNQLKAVGLTLMTKDVTLTVPLTPADLTGECDSASSGTCASVVHVLQSLAETQAWAIGVGTIGLTYNKIVEFLFGVAGPKLRYVVIYPDGSFEIYEFIGSGGATGFAVVPNTSVSSSGGTVGGTLQGWSSYVPSGLANGVTTVRILGATRAGASGGCRVFTVVVETRSIAGVSDGGC